MSEAAKTRLTEIMVGQKHPKKFRVPNDKVKGILILLDDYKVTSDDESVAPDEAFKYLYEQFGKAGTLLAGYRLRDGFTQLELAEKLGTSQSAVAGMERGKRPISKQMANKLAKIFSVNYRVFL